jgi:putative transposase
VDQYLRGAASLGVGWEPLQEVIDTTASFWNKPIYARRQRFVDGESIWETDEFRGQYKCQISAVGVQTVTRKNNAAWNSFMPPGRTS